MKTIFLTLQGEGHHAGRRAVFCRFSGCNGWSGRVEDREHGPLSCSQWCDTDFRGTDGPNGGKYEAAQLAARCADLWGPERTHRFVVLTGGEPLLQANALLVDALHRFGFAVAVETNGTRKVPTNIDWITVSPKAGVELAIGVAQELKLVYPQPGAEPERYAAFDARYRYLQPLWVEDEAKRAEYRQAAVAYCLAHPEWRLGLQTHKIVGLP